MVESRFCLFLQELLPQHVQPTESQGISVQCGISIYSRTDFVVLKGAKCEWSALFRVATHRACTSLVFHREELRRFHNYFMEDTFLLVEPTVFVISTLLNTREASSNPIFVGRVLLRMQQFQQAILQAWKENVSSIFT